MYTVENQEKFIALRAQGWTLGHIGTELGISKRTLIDWNREFAESVQSLRVIELELLKEKGAPSRQETVARLTRLQEDIADELASRTLKYIDTEKLFRLSVDLRHEIDSRLGDQEQESPKLTGNGQAREVFPTTNGNDHH